jgi:cathepsin B
MGCNGGYPSGAWSYFKSKGLVSGDLFGDSKWCRPYTFPPCDHHVDDGKYGPCGDSKPTPSCVKSCTKESGRVYDTDKIHSVDSYSVSSKVE